MPARAMMRMISGTHEFWYRLSGGLIGGRFGRLPILLLTTTGRTSGLKRTTPLVYLPDGKNMIIIGSNGGSDKHPEWWLNLRSQPKAEVQVGRDVRTVVAHKADGDERERLWRQAVELYYGYDEYRRMARREIPVVVLAPDN
ncbi:MAG: nitroreductase family deazaflavin-dependent oxidoreductase [Chloroflexi bacterium]|jgi:F420H(2)-dependent quinone reductase|nr:MAG: nitroreductase family deazaflavin-dependent oxidoreductase [Chloroflexota bacterium]TMG06464.1 MAG: nitroreductase family deazaflavin-dependent oxidoreductase [Chloroflexota bacterium]